MAKVGADLIKPVIDAARSVEGTEQEVASAFCQSDKGIINLTTPEKYIPGKTYPGFKCNPETRKIGTIHSHRLPNNKLSYFDMQNDEILHSRLACVTADDGAGVYQTRCYLLDPLSSKPEELDSYYEIYHDLNKAAEAFLIDAVGSWIIKEMII